MGGIFTFLLLATVTPFLLTKIKRSVFAVVQSILVLGMWVYAYQALVLTVPDMFSISWFMFYSSLIGAHIGWIQFIIALATHYQPYSQQYDYD